jgi:hypothetical protein
VKISHAAYLGIYNFGLRINGVVYSSTRSSSTRIEDLPNPQLQVAAGPHLWLTHAPVSAIRSETGCCRADQLHRPSKTLPTGNTLHRRHGDITKGMTHDYQDETR